MKKEPIEGDVEAATIHHLKISGKYKLRITAVNKYGIGNPSNESGPLRGFVPPTPQCDSVPLIVNRIDQIDLFFLYTT